MSSSRQSSKSHMRSFKPSFKALQIAIALSGAVLFIGCSSDEGPALDTKEIQASNKDVPSYDPPDLTITVQPEDSSTEVANPPKENSDAPPPVHHRRKHRKQVKPPEDVKPRDPDSSENPNPDPSNDPASQVGGDQPSSTPPTEIPDTGGPGNSPPSDPSQNRGAGNPPN